jgi:hypothetical protein
LKRPLTKGLREFVRAFFPSLFDYTINLKSIGQFSLDRFARLTADYKELYKIAFIVF